MASGIPSAARLTTACLSLGLALAVIGCTSENEQRACTLLACESGLHVRVDPTSGWPDGSYRFAVDADGQHVVCAGSLPLPSCGTSAITCDRTDVVRITESGCALATGSQSFPEIRFDAGLRPKAVTIDVFRNDASVGHLQLAPDFQVTQPNGPGCDPICQQASATMQLTF